MWERATLDLPKDVAAKTTSIWLAPGIMYVGVMRETTFAPPYLWGEAVKGGLHNLRKAPGLLDELQEFLFMQTVFAEVETDLLRNQALLLYLGFTYVNDLPSRRLYQRSI